MKLDRQVIVHRKDAKGVVVESGVFGPGDDLPEWAATALKGPAPSEPAKVTPRPPGKS